MRLGVVADTHIPDRLRQLPAGLPAALAGVDAILHAGDITTRGVLEQLGRIAPVQAVGGNRDFFLRLPLDRVLVFDGVRVGLTHGHGGLGSYLLEKLLYVTVGYDIPRYLRQVRARFAGSGVQVIVFGHSHRMVNTVADGVLLFNPGCVAPDYHRPFYGPTVGILTIANGRVRGEVVPVS